MSETVAPFNARGVSWPTIFKALGWAIPILVSAGMLYLGKEFASHTEVATAVQLFSALPAKVQSLDEFRGRQETAQAASQAKFEAVQTSIATLTAQQAGTDKKIDRVLDYLERQQRHSDK